MFARRSSVFRNASQIRLVIFYAALGSTLFAPSAHAQRFVVEETRSNIQSYYFHVQPGVATVQVEVLGTVRSPGLYELSQGTDLGQLLALSGGPVLPPRESSSRRDVYVRLFRPRGNMRELVFENKLEDVLNSSSVYPVLQDQDVLTVEVVERRGFNWRDVLSIVGAVAAVGLAASRLAELVK